MAFSARFPRTTDKSMYPKWEEIYLSENEELELDELARKENIKLMRECIRDAKKIVLDEKLKDFQTDIIHIAISLFEKTYAAKTKK